MTDILKIDALEQLKPFLNDKNVIEIVIRGKNKKFKAFQKIALENLGQNQEQKEIVQKMMNALNKNNEINVKNMKALENVAKLDQLNLLMNGLNLCATCVGFAIVCHKINNMSEKITQVLSTIKTTTDLNLNYEFKQCLSEHEKMLDHRKTQDYFTLDRMEDLVAKEYDVLEYLVNHFMNDTTNDKEILLYSILTLSSMLSLSLRYYDEEYYFKYKESIKNGNVWHTSHKKWNSIYDKIASDEFIKKVQDYGFLELNLTTLGCDAFYINVNDSVLGYKQDIIDNQELLTIFETKEILDAYSDYSNQDVKQSIYDVINESYEIKSNSYIMNTLNESMQQIGIMH